MAHPQRPKSHHLHQRWPPSALPGSLTDYTVIPPRLPRLPFVIAGHLIETVLTAANYIAYLTRRR